MDQISSLHGRNDCYLPQQPPVQGDEEVVAGAEVAIDPVQSRTAVFRQLGSESARPSTQPTKGRCATPGSAVVQGGAPTTCRQTAKI